MLFDANTKKTLGISAGLITLNIIIMWAMAFTKLALIPENLFGIPIIGIIVYGLALTLGNHFAQTGIAEGENVLAYIGLGLLQFAYATFGAGILAPLSPQIQAIVIGLTGVLTLAFSIVSALLVYTTGASFRNWKKYSLYFFIGVLVFGAIGTAFSPVLILAFISALLGFMSYLVYEIWRMRVEPSRVYLNGIGIYVAFMGIFVQLLRIVVYLLSILAAFEE